MGEGKHFADAGRQVFTLWINNLLACLLACFSPDFIAAFTSACVLRARRAASPHRNVNHCLVIFGSLSFSLPSELRPTLMHEVKAAKAAEQKMLLNYLRSRKGEEGRGTMGGGGEKVAL